MYATQWMKHDGNATVRAATPGLMDALSVRIRSGRFFTDGDTAASLLVMVVNQTFVNRYLDGGCTWQADSLRSCSAECHHCGRYRRRASGRRGRREPARILFVHVTNCPGPADLPALLGRFMQVAVRTEIAPDILISELRRAIQKANPHLAIGACSTMAEAVEDSIGSQKSAAQVIAVFGGLVLLTTVVGLYGLLSYLVTQRTQEIGIRMALGADRGRVVSMILRQS
jgi:hypothetical protein